eukprot:758185-Hanusia_phi.AAC.6
MKKIDIFWESSKHFTRHKGRPPTTKTNARTGVAEGNKGTILVHSSQASLSWYRTNTQLLAHTLVEPEAN